MKMYGKILILQLPILFFVFAIAWYLKPTHPMVSIDIKNEKPLWFFVINPDPSSANFIVYADELSSAKTSNNKTNSSIDNLIILNQNQYIGTILKYSKMNLNVRMGKETVGIYSVTLENHPSGGIVTICAGPPHAYGVRYKFAGNRIVPVDWFRVEGLRARLFSRIKWVSISLAVWFFLTVGSWLVFANKR